MKNKLYDFLKALITEFIPPIVGGYMFLARFLPDALPYPDMVGIIAFTICWVIGRIIKVEAEKYWSENMIVPRLPNADSE
jgi:hypothetical protein